MTDVLTPFVAGQSSLLLVFLQVATASSEDMRGLATAPLTLLAELVVVSDPAIICCMCSSVMRVEVVTVTGHGQHLLLVFDVEIVSQRQ